MKKIIVVVSTLIILSIAGYASYHFYFSPNYLAVSIMEDISNGKFNSIFKLYNDKRITSQFAYQMAIEKNQKPNFRYINKIEKQLFQYPRNIISYKLTSTISSKTDYWCIDDLSEEYYNDVFKNNFSSYDKYFNMMMENHKLINSKKQGYKYNKELKQVQYIEKKVGRKKFNYKIITTSGVRFCSLIFINTPVKGWKLAMSTNNRF